MKRLKGRILLGTAAVAAALTISGCSPNQNANTAEDDSSTAVTAQTAATIRDFEKFDVNENYNNVVYGPPPER